MSTSGRQQTCRIEAQPSKKLEDTIDSENKYESEATKFINIAMKKKNKKRLGEDESFRGRRSISRTKRASLTFGAKGELSLPKKMPRDALYTARHLRWPAVIRTDFPRQASCGADIQYAFTKISACSQSRKPNFESLLSHEASEFS
ncbi:hypothetical protein PM082_009469 [Marasmius tenuissimus]|nr:hypothetical protein PM082_009469 [Marasmius tenuissimus]